MKLIKWAFYILFIFVLQSCEPVDPNINRKGEDILEEHEMTKPIDRALIGYTDTIYVPIYSSIYVHSNNIANLLAATLSIRNTSLKDNLYVTSIDYYNSKGDLVRHFVDNVIELKPMETIDYVIERDDDSGGSGANFIVTLDAKADFMNPIVQAVMIGNSSNQGISFVTDGVSIKTPLSVHELITN